MSAEDYYYDYPARGSPDTSGMTSQYKVSPVFTSTNPQADVPTTTQYSGSVPATPLPYQRSPFYQMIADATCGRRHPSGNPPSSVEPAESAIVAAPVPRMMFGQIDLNTAMLVFGVTSVFWLTFFSMGLLFGRLLFSQSR